MSSDNLIDFNQPRNFSAKMNATYGFIRQNFKGLSKSLLIIAGPPVLVAGVFFIDIFQRMISSATGAAEAPGPFSTLNDLQSPSFVMQFFGIILFMLLGGVFTVSTTHAYMFLYREKGSASIEIREVWQRVRKTFWMNFLGMMGFTFFLVLALIILMIPLGILVFLFAAAGSTVISSIVLVVGYLAYYVFTFFLVINFSMIFTIQNFELIGFFKSIDRIFFFNRGKWWSTFGIGGINVYVQYVFAIILFLPGYLIMILQATHSMSDTPLSEPSFISQLITSISFVLYFLGSILLSALPMVALAFQYFNLVELKLSKGLMSRIETLGQTVTATDHHAEF